MFFMCAFLFLFNSMLFSDFCQNFFLMINPLVKFCVTFTSAWKSKKYKFCYHKRLSGYSPGNRFSMSFVILFHFI